MKATKEVRFKPRPGQIDYTNIKRAPVINCAVKHGGKILLVKRSRAMSFYPGYWNGVSGFLDDKKSIAEKAKEEIKEELGLKKRDILIVKQGKIFKQNEPKYNKIWIVHPILVEVKSSKMKLSWEAGRYRWLKPQEIKKYKLLPGFEKVLATFFPVVKLKNLRWTKRKK